MQNEMGNNGLKAAHESSKTTTPIKTKKASHRS